MVISTKGISSVDIVSNVSKANSKSKSEEKASDSFSSIINMTSNELNKDTSGNFNKSTDSITSANDVNKNQSDKKISLTSEKKTNDDSESNISGKKTPDNVKNSKNDVDQSANTESDKNIKNEDDVNTNDVIISDESADNEAEIDDFVVVNTYNENLIEGVQVESIQAEDVQAEDVHTPFMPVIDETDDIVKISSVLPDKTEDTDKKIDDIISEFAAELANLINDIKNIIEQKLDVTDDDINDAMSSLGLGSGDLLNTENVNEIVFEIQDVSEVDILINEQIASLVKDIDSTVSDMIREFEAFDIEAEDFLNNETLENKYIPVDTEGNVLNEVQVSLKDIIEKVDEISNEEDIELADYKATDYSDISQNADNINDDVKITVNNGADNQTSKDGSSESFDTMSESIINNLSNAINEVVAEDVEGTQAFTEDIQQADILRQVVDEIKANISNDVTTLDMRLNPESLGKVQITVSSRNGVMEAHIVAETEAAKNAIEANIATLRETLNNQDLKVEAVEVTIANYGFFEDEQQGMAEGDKQNNNNSRNGHVNSNGMADETSSDEPLETEILRAQGSSVSYSI